MIQSITGRALGVTAALAAVVALAQPASAQSYERLLAGIRLNSPASAVLAKFGNPNEVVIGEIGVRGAPNAAAAAANNAAAAQGGAAGGFPGGGGGLPGLGGGGRGGDDDGPGGGGFPGGGPPAGFGGGQGGFPGGGFGGGRGGGGGAGAGQFGLTQSPVTLQQEVTWIYYRKFNNNQVAYEFLIGPSGNISQIRVSGYSGGNIFTRRGIGLGSTYRTVVRAYGYPEDHQQVGRILVTSYRNKAHISFQFLNERSATNALDSGNKVIAITIATVE